KEHPKSSWGWYALGYSQFAQRKIGESIQVLAKSLEFDVRNAEAHKILGRDLMIVGRLDAARTEFEQGIHYNPQSSEMHFNLGKLFSIQDSWVAARKEFEAALGIDSSYMEESIPSAASNSFRAATQLSWMEKSLPRNPWVTGSERL